MRELFGGDVSALKLDCAFKQEVTSLICVLETSFWNWY